MTLVPLRLPEAAMNTGCGWKRVARSAILPLLLAGVVLATGPGAWAKKPVKPPPPPPEAAYTMHLLGAGFGLRAMNELGQIAGEYQWPPGEGVFYEARDTDGDGVVDLWFEDVLPEGDPDGLNDLLLPMGRLSGDERSIAAGLDDQGLVVGFSGDDGGWYGRAVLWRGAELLDLGVAIDTSLVSFAKDVNNHGVVFGGMWRGTGSTTGVEGQHFVIVPGDETEANPWFADENGDGLNDRMITLGKDFAGTDISDAGWIAGRYNTGVASGTEQPAVLIPRDEDGDGSPDTWFVDEDLDEVNDLMVLLPVPEGTAFGSAVAINENGWLVGSWNDTRLVKRAALWQLQADGTYRFVDLGGVRSCAYASARDINDDNLIVGSGGNTKKFRRDNGTWGYIYTSVPVLWENGVQTKLEELVDTGGQALGGPCALNDRGDVLLYGTEGSGPVLLLPVP